MFSSRTLLERGELELVIAKYNEDVSWLGEFNSLASVVYDKSGGMAQNPLPNVGREAHTYLHHIVTNYDRLAEVTVFLQGDPHDHVPNLHDKVWSIERGVGFRDLSDHILVENACGEPVQPGLRVKELYEALFDAPGPDYFVCHSAACFAVSRDNILSRPRSFYEKARDLVVHRKLGPWEIERLWQYIFQAKARSQGIITAADSGFFRDLQFLVHSHLQKDQYPLAVIDLGLDQNQRDWCLDQPGVGVLAMPHIYKPVERIRSRHWWQTWLKPFYIYHVPFDRVVWMDADCVILGDLSEAFELIESQPLLVRDGTDVVTENHPLLYKHLPLPKEARTKGVNLNAGVVGLCKIRDRTLLNAWSYGVAWAAMNPEKQALSAWADQGMLLWAVHQTGMVNAIQSELDWNFPAGQAPELIANAVNNRHSILDELCQKYPNANVAHWLGTGKLSGQLIDQLERLFVMGFGESPIKRGRHA